jgi:excisionase family DNA binding protein
MTPAGQPKPPLVVNLVSITMKEAPMAEALRATQAARNLGIPTKELQRLVHEHKIRYVMVRGMAHIPVDALDEYRKRSSA